MTVGHTSSCAGCETHIGRIVLCLAASLEAAQGSLAQAKEDGSSQSQPSHAEVITGCVVRGCWVCVGTALRWDKSRRLYWEDNS